MTHVGPAVQEQQTRPQPHTSGLRLIERSVFCDRMVFVKAVHALEQLSDLELKVYDSWFNPCLQRTPELVPDGFVYLRTNAETCERRMRHRNRCEETGVERSYLEKLLGYHDSWLVDGARALEGQALAPPGGGSLVLGAGHRTLNRLAPAGAPLPHLFACRDRGPGLRCVVHRQHKRATQQGPALLRLRPGVLASTNGPICLCSPGL